MNRMPATVGFVGALLCTALSAQPPSTVAFVDVNVVPMDRERVLMHQTVLVRDGAIAALGSRVDIPADARRVEGDGTAWLVPGLADMHTHLVSGEDAALYAAAGVTTVLQMGGDGRIEPIPVLRALLAQAPLAPQVFFACQRRDRWSARAKPPQHRRADAGRHLGRRSLTAIDIRPGCATIEPR